MFLKDIPAGKPLEATIPKEVPFNQVSCRYTPHVCLIRKKGKLLLSSSDDILHNVRAEGAASFNKAMPTPGIVLKQKLRKAGIVQVSCDAGHYWMSATVFVVEHPYYAVTDGKGAFTLTDVPPGTYTLVLWKENWEIAETIEKDGVPSRIVYEDPIVIEREVTVEAGGTVEATFTLPAAGA